MLRYGVPDYRLPQDVLDAEIQKILDLGVEVVLNTVVGADISLETLRSRHSSLYLGIGHCHGYARGGCWRRQFRDGCRPLRPAGWGGSDHPVPANT